VEINDSDFSSIELDRINQCRQLLLEAGADPSIANSYYQTTAFEAVLASGSLGSIKVFLDFGRHFVDIETRDIRGSGLTPLLQFCMGLGYGYHKKDGMAFLLQRGANVHVVDSYGKSCLHLAVYGARGPSRFDEEFEALVLLIKAGADVYAKDNSGRSVSQVAYHRASIVRDRDLGIYWDLGSYWGDFWDSVLATCGYQVSSFRLQHPRTERYTEDYPRKVFKMFWEGKQHLCPYWNDEEESSPSASDEEDEGTDFELEDSDSGSE